MKRIFLDSSVLFSATCSIIGGSSRLISEAKAEFIVSDIVLTETERNVRNKLESYHLKDLKIWQVTCH